MIVYSLACDHGHFFEGWFASAGACDRQAAAGQLACPTCSSDAIRKLPSAPYVKSAAGSDAASGAPGEAQKRAQAIKALRKAIVENTEDVGRRFAEVARRIHYKEEAERNIRGQVTVAEAVALHEEGVEAVHVPAEVLPTEEVH